MHTGLRSSVAASQSGRDTVAGHPRSSHGSAMIATRDMERNSTNLSLDKDAPIHRSIQPPGLGKVVELLRKI